jgi:hypothetical protein
MDEPKSTLFAFAAEGRAREESRISLANEVAGMISCNGRNRIMIGIDTYFLKDFTRIPNVFLTFCCEGQWIVINILYTSGLKNTNFIMGKW